MVACENIVDARRPKQPRPGHRSGFHVVYDVFQAPGAAPQRFKLTLEVVEQSEDEEEQQGGPGGSAVESGVPWRGVLREYAAAARSRSTGSAQPPRFSSWAPLPAAPEPEHLRESSEANLGLQQSQTGFVVPEARGEGRARAPVGCRIFFAAVRAEASGRSPNGSSIQRASTVRFCASVVR